MEMEPLRAMTTHSPARPVAENHPGASLGGPSPVVADHYHALWGRLNGLGGGDQPPRTIGVTSCARGEGVTTIAANLALAAAESLAGQQVLAIDANPRAAALHRHLAASGTSSGLTDVLAGRSDWREAITPTIARNVSLLTAGEIGARLTSAADLARCAELLSDWQAKFDVVLFDLPPVAEAGLTLPLAGMLDGVLLVIESERTAWETADRAKNMLNQSHARLLGAVLNERRASERRWMSRGKMRG